MQRDKWGKDSLSIIENNNQSDSIDFLSIAPCESERKITNIIIIIVSGSSCSSTASTFNDIDRYTGVHKS